MLFIRIYVHLFTCSHASSAQIGLASNRSIRILNVECNLLREAGGRALLELLRREEPRSALETVYYESGNSIPGDLLAAISETLEKRRRE